MANIVVTSTADVIKVDFGDYYPTYIGVQIAYYNANSIQRAELYSNMVQVKVLEDRDWELSYDGSAGFQVDSVDMVAPTSNSDLLDKIGALIKS